jgi:hypothetical protein
MGTATDGQRLFLPALPAAAAASAVSDPVLARLRYPWLPRVFGHPDASPISPSVSSRVRAMQGALQRAHEVSICIFVLDVAIDQSSMPTLENCLNFSHLFD